MPIQLQVLAKHDCCLLQVHTAGGGAASNVWNQIRQGLLGVPVVRSRQAEAAYGAALLACQTLLCTS